MELRFLDTHVLIHALKLEERLLGQKKQKQAWGRKERIMEENVVREHNIHEWKWQCETHHCVHKIHVGENFNRNKGADKHDHDSHHTDEAEVQSVLLQHQRAQTREAEGWGVKPLHGDRSIAFYLVLSSWSLTHRPDSLWMSLYSAPVTNMSAEQCATHSWNWPRVKTMTYEMGTALIPIFQICKLRHQEKRPSKLLGLQPGYCLPNNMLISIPLQTLSMNIRNKESSLLGEGQGGHD